MTEETALRRLRRLAKLDDTESAHAEGDRVLVAFLRTNGYKAIADAWNEITPKWYA